MNIPAWNGRVLIDATNPFIETSPKLVMADLGGVGASEIVARLAPGARVVKTLNSIVTARFNEGPIKGDGRRIIFVSGGDAEAKVAVKALIESFGFAVIDLGGLVPGGRMQQAGGPLAGDSTCSWRADVPLWLMISGPETLEQDFGPRCTSFFRGWQLSAGLRCSP